MNSEISRDKATGSNRGVLSACVALVVLVALMVVSYFYPYPSGKRPDFLSLLMLWGREALIVVTALVLLVVLAVGAIIKALKSRGAPDA
ncbi:hypothetical protein LNV09_24440 [Paucibacter sp. B2R-40]|uniref:hypothetical protein n=1 Tax=Paucibacter sp. B2R-40 TaxID=2893554 RepID=UPI0021E3F833|nr:hypothetical protein [Paucibacter sp. B2R-40]MCV2357306.1 hypothetical protein [Paucibacter sp. B2R-40]